MGTGIVSRSVFLSQDVDIGITGYFHFEIGGQTLWITTTHVSLLIVVIALSVFAFLANRAIKRANPEDVPGPFLNAIELMV
ncbi:MAG: ATP synthase F0 subunit A, partial [Lachnospiraceae bacterium]